MSDPVHQGVRVRISVTGGWPAAVQLILFSCLLFTLGWLVVHPIGPLAPAVVILLYGVASLFVGRLSRQDGAGSPYQRLSVRQTLAVLAYIVVLIASMGANQEFHLAGPAQWLVALAPAIPLLGAIAMIWLYLKEEKDEFQRTVFIHAQVLAMGATLAICTVYGMLEAFGIVRHIQLWYVFPFFILCSTPARSLVSGRYR